ncbi:hypothetical protein D3C71_1572770 [compost metagenome]
MARNWRRLGSPVNTSKYASWCTCRSARVRSVISRDTTMKLGTAPRTPCLRATDSSKQRASPQTSVSSRLPVLRPSTCASLMALCRTCAAFCGNTSHTVRLSTWFTGRFRLAWLLVRIAR